MTNTTERKINYWMTLIIFLLIIILCLAGLLAQSNNQLKRCSSPKTQQAISKEFSEWYSVEYPSNFFVTRKYYNTFGIGEEKWKGKMGHIPEAAIETYTNIIPDGMSLRDWLNGVSSPTPPVGDRGTPKSCKEFLDRLRQQLKYGDLFNEYLKGTDCIYFGVTYIKDKTVAGFPALEFNTSNVSSRATHTILVYKNQAGSTLLFDIYFTETGISDEKDQTTKAYNSFIDTFKIRTNQNDTAGNANNHNKAIQILQMIPEIQTIQNSVVKAGRKPFYTAEGESGDIVTISIRESFPDDPHTSRIDTFNVNVKSKVVTVEDVVSGKDIPFAVWKKTVKERFQE